MFDAFRKKWTAATPEELVRQNFCLYLVNVKHYPASMIANEITVDINGQKQRCDTLVFKSGKYSMLIEYKAENVPVSRAVMDQAMRYNSRIRAGYVVITNLKQCYCCKIDFQSMKATFLKDIPDWDEL